jgi:hypothetical protein
MTKYSEPTEQTLLKTVNLFIIFSFVTQTENPDVTQIRPDKPNEIDD